MQNAAAVILAHPHPSGVAEVFVWPGCSAFITPSVANLPSPHIHVQSFGRFDEITDLVEETSALTLARRRRVRRASPTRLPGSRPKPAVDPLSRPVTRGKQDAIAWFLLSYHVVLAVKALRCSRRSAAALLDGVGFAEP